MQLTADLVTFTEEIFNGKLCFLCSAWRKFCLKNIFYPKYERHIFFILSYLIWLHIKKEEWNSLVILVRIFLHSDWNWRDKKYLSVTPNTDTFYALKFYSESKKNWIVWYEKGGLVKMNQIKQKKSNCNAFYSNTVWIACICFLNETYMFFFMIRYVAGCFKLLAG